MMTPSTPGNQIHLIDAGNQPSIDLLQLAYDQIYCAAVPPEDREDLDTWINNLAGNDEYVDMAVSIVGEHLDTHSPTIKGICVGFYYRETDTALIGYNLVAAEHLGEITTLKQPVMEYTAGALKNLSAAHGGALDGVFLEVDDPTRISGKAASMEAANEVAMLESFGAKTVDIRYIPPPYAPDAQKNLQLQLMHYNPDGTPPEKDTVRRFVTSIYEGLAENLFTTVEDDPDLAEMLREIDGLKSTVANDLAAGNVIKGLKISRKPGPGE